MNLPALPLEEWRASKETLHRFAQIVGKIRMGAVPHRNHWWHATLYVTPRGLTTGAMPAGKGSFEIELDFLGHELRVRTSWGERDAFPLEQLSVAGCYWQLTELLAGFGIEPDILAIPYDLSPKTPFPSDDHHAAYDRDYIERYFEILRFSDQVLQEFAGSFTGKQSPSHLFWHSLDLALGRYSGRRAPDLPDADFVTREAYSHEVIAVGFWAGDDNIPAPAYYSYTWPEPDGLRSQPLHPEAAHWGGEAGNSRALLMYDDLRALPDPHDALLKFFESCYLAGARAGGWPVEELRTVRFR